MNIVIAFGIVGVVVVGAATQQSTDALASLVSDLGKCEATLGSLRQLQASAIKGDVLDLQTIKTKIEKANPLFEFDVKSFTVKERAEKTHDSDKVSGDDGY